MNRMIVKVLIRNQVDKILLVEIMVLMLVVVLDLRVKMLVIKYRRSKEMVKENLVHKKKIILSHKNLYLVNYLLDLINKQINKIKVNNSNSSL
jgi:hypothetical protein